MLGMGPTMEKAWGPLLNGSTCTWRGVSWGILTVPEVMSLYLFSGSELSLGLKLTSSEVEGGFTEGVCTEGAG